MKLNFSNRKDGALTTLEVLVIVVCLVILGALLLPILARPGRHVSRINCVSNLRQVNIEFQIWARDNSDRYPMAISVTNGGAMEFMETGSLAACLQCGASNEMTTTKIFVCPVDTARTFATNWNDLNGSHISYFVSADARNDDDASMVLNGDDNLEIGGKPVASGLLNLSSNAPVSWSGTRHRFRGNIGLADGSVEQVFTSDNLQRVFQGTGLSTNRIVLP